MSRAENRLRLYSVDELEMLDIFAFALEGWPAYVRLPLIEGLPPDCRVDGLHHDFAGRRFLFRVSHPSFDEVPTGQPLKLFNGFEYRVVEMPLKVREVPAECDVPAVVEA